MAIGAYNFVAVPIGTIGNGIQVTISAHSGINTPLSIAVVGTHITVTPATDGVGSLVSTVADIVALISTTPAAFALVTASITTSGTTPEGTATLAGGTGGAVGVDRAIGVKIKDWTGKYYMNDFVPLDMIYGYDNSQTPGLLYPEIYIPRQQNIFFELKGLPSGAGTSIVTLTHKGEKVYA